jgi:DNA-binding GntR family transcriptional regulator
MSESRLGRLLGNAEDLEDAISRSSLKTQTLDLVRNYIVGGQIPPGTKLVEREVAELLGISRAPVRDALMELEQEGLVISRPSGRYVIQLSRRDISNLYQVRIALEKLATRLAAQNATPESSSALSAQVAAMQAAVAKQDREGYVEADLKLHRLVWTQADNSYLLSTLAVLSGPIFMFVANNARILDWPATQAEHEEMVELVNAGDANAAAEQVEQQLLRALEKSLQVFQAT